MPPKDDHGSALRKLSRNNQMVDAPRTLSRIIKHSIKEDCVQWRTEKDDMWEE